MKNINSSTHSKRSDTDGGGRLIAHTPIADKGIANKAIAEKSITDKSMPPKESKFQVDLNADRFSKTALKNTKKIIKRCYVEESPIHGKGLFATKPIKAGISLGRLQGMLTDEDGTYVLWLNKKIGFEITNEFRFINHDSNPNCALTDMEVITLRPLEKDEELTHDYGW